MHKYASIEQFRNVIKNVQNQARYTGRDENGNAIFDRNAPLPILKFRGTVKIHGTNAGVVYDIATGDLVFQSRERVLSLTQDNAGFMLAMLNKREQLQSIFESLLGTLNTNEIQYTKIALYGEWCGQGIQKGVAVSQLPKMFVIFAAKFICQIDDGQYISQWIDLQNFKFDTDDCIYSIYNFPTWEVEIDFANPQLIQNDLIKITEQVEAECPVGKHFGVSSVGEGVVWHCIEPGWGYSDTIFKVKGAAHSVSKVKTLAAVDVEAVKNLNEFVDKVVTEARLEQGLHVLQTELLKPFEMQSLGDFIRWIIADIAKEESDVIVASQLDPKKLGGPIANKARPWFIKKLNEN